MSIILILCLVMYEKTRLHNNQTINDQKFLNSLLISREDVPQNLTAYYHQDIDIGFTYYQASAVEYQTPSSKLNTLHFGVFRFKLEESAANGYKILSSQANAYNSRSIMSMYQSRADDQGIYCTDVDESGAKILEYCQVILRYGFYVYDVAAHIGTGYLSQDEFQEIIDRVSEKSCQYIDTKYCAPTNLLPYREILNIRGLSSTTSFVIS